MNYATKLCIVSMMSVFSVSSIGLVQAADTPIVSTGGAAYNIGIPGDSNFTNSDNVSLGGQAGTSNGNPYQKPNDPNAKGNNIAIGRISLNGSSGGANVALGSKTFLNGKGDYNFLGNFAAGFNSTISNTIAIGSFAGSGATGNKNVWLGAGQAGGSTGNNTVLIGSNSTVDGNFNYGIGHNAVLKGESNAVVGAYNHVTANNTYVLGDHVDTTLNNAVVLGSHSTAESSDVVSTPSYTYAGGTVNFAGTAPVSTVSVGATNQERTITHVAAGRVSADSTDAINGSQLYGANQQIDNLYNKISNIGKEANKGDARAAALAALHPMQFDPDNRVQVMGGIGHYKDANALALGVGYYPKENLLLTAGATVNDHIMANLGVSYKFGENKTLQKISPASYNALEQRVDTLEAQNKKLQETVDMLVQKLNNR
ncbi:MULTISPECIES: YadA-like family protein [Veillonella]|uniref:YadA-like family protein n=1 Tax=Veillonella TaxID=29465 RepID=UPI001D05F60B|nr:MULTISPECIES: YadA-like family protein [Veillonella]MBS6122411.1 YadA-like family protein [Veillonella sp.]MCB6515949.1 YadA-like family protein [Veillonella atypica]MCG4863604.1 YadA-like family protein [Veillonella atypica]MDU6632612.1 YadA-like family protein [Veillonella sp.]MDU6734843.1 YadA-like family protein [Veillonella sp.]